jgi:hypothetical protein
MNIMLQRQTYFSMVKIKKRERLYSDFLKRENVHCTLYDVQCPGSVVTVLCIPGKVHTG